MPITTEDDIITLLVQDHHMVEQAFEEIADAGGERRAELFWILTDQLVRHEVAEEIALYSELRRVPAGDVVADARIAEQSAAELQGDVREHAHREEAEVFPLLATSSDLDRRIAMGNRYERAKRAAPSHPHPNAPDTPPGNLILGPMAAMLDRIRDAAASS